MIELEQYFWLPIDVFNGVYPYLFSFYGYLKWLKMTYNLFGWDGPFLGRRDRMVRRDEIARWDEIVWQDESGERDETKQQDMHASTVATGMYLKQSKTKNSMPWRNAPQTKVVYGAFPHHLKWGTSMAHCPFLLWRTLRYSYRKEKRRLEVPKPIQPFHICTIRHTITTTGS